MTSATRLCSSWRRSRNTDAYAVSWSSPRVKRYSPERREPTGSAISCSSSRRSAAPKVVVAEVRDLSQEPDGELHAQHRRGLGHRLGPAEPVESPGQGTAQRRRHRLGLTVFARCPQHLLEEQWDAFGAGRHPCERGPRPTHAARDGRSALSPAGRRGVPAGSRARRRGPASRFRLRCVRSGA